MNTHPDLPSFLQSLAALDPSEVQGWLGPFSDWLEERSDSRAEVVRALHYRGPVDVEPVCPYDDDARFTDGKFAGYRTRFECECGFFINFAPSPMSVTVCGSCPHCTRLWWGLTIDPADAHREMQHRLRVEAMYHFVADWPDEFQSPETDPRWPQLEVQVDNGLTYVARRSNQTASPTVRPSPVLAARPTP